MASQTMSTQTRGSGGKRARQRPEPLPAFYGIAEAARILGIRPETVKWHLRARPELFEEARYRRVGPHPRLHRALGLKDLKVLMGLILKPAPLGWKKRRGAARSAEKARESGLHEEAGAGR